MSKNWKTTLLGILAGVAMTFGQMAQNRATMPGAPPLTVGTVLPGLAIAALGAFASDSKVTPPTS